MYNALCYMYYCRNVLQEHSPVNQPLWPVRTVLMVSPALTPAQHLQCLAPVESMQSVMEQLERQSAHFVRVVLTVHSLFLYQFHARVDTTPTLLDLQSAPSALQVTSVLIHQ